MRASWETLHAALVRSVTKLKADTRFKQAAKDHSELSRFGSPDALTAYLATKEGDLDQKDRIYAVLVRAAQSRSDWSDLAIPLLWLGLWPGLDAIYRHRLRDFVGRVDDLVTEITIIFIATVKRIDLGGVNRLAATLVWNVERDLRDRLKRRWAEDARTAKTEALDASVPDGQPQIDDRDLPVDANDCVAVRKWLTGIVQGEADLVIGVVLYGFDLHELADELGIAHDAARKRFQRAINRMRGHTGQKC
jgi:RNA polymerase sigma-70 factor (ECF subfamily)